MKRNVCLVTGASSGIGRACADRLAAAGWTVVGASRRVPTSVAWQPLTLDVDAGVSDGIAQVLDQHGRIDALVTAAGFGLSGPVETTPLEQARAQMETNFWGTVRVVREVLPHMREHGGGRVVLIGSLGGLIGLPFQAYYSASKYALEGFGEALAYEVARSRWWSPATQPPGSLTTGGAATRLRTAPTRRPTTRRSRRWKAMNAPACPRNGWRRRWPRCSPPAGPRAGSRWELRMSGSGPSRNDSCRTPSSSGWPAVRWDSRAGETGVPRKHRAPAHESPHPRSGIT